MSKRSDKALTKAYRNLKVKEYIGLIKDTMVPYFDDFDGEFVLMMSPDTKITLTKHFLIRDDRTEYFCGYNVYADNKLLESFDTRREAKKFIAELVRDVRGGCCK